MNILYKVRVLAASMALCMTVLATSVATTFPEGSSSSPTAEGIAG